MSSPPRSSYLPLHSPATPPSPSPSPKPTTLKLALLLTPPLLFITGLLIYLFLPLPTSTSTSTSQKSVILLISDGFGPASQTFARGIYRTKYNIPEYVSPLDTILVGSSRTKSAESIITDSAAGATAFSCGIKTYNGAIGVDTGKVPCATVLEAAKFSGYKTGLVSTSRVTHATPASFAAHVVHRDMEAEIALHEMGYTPLGPVVDVILGGGKCAFLPKSNNASCRTDEKDLFTEASSSGLWQTLDTRLAFDQLNSTYKNISTLGLFAPGHMDFEIDRDPLLQPSLVEMANTALAILQEKVRTEEAPGFFMMIEGSRIDMAAHNNDPATHALEIHQYWEMVDTVKRFVDDHPGSVLISVSDHETGGLDLGRQKDPNVYPDYIWYPSAILGVNASTEKLARQVVQQKNETTTSLQAFVQNIFAQNLGLNDTTSSDTDYIVSILQNNTLSEAKMRSSIQDYLGQLVTWRAGVMWSTHGHTGVDVNLYSYAGQSKTSNLLGASVENNNIGAWIEDYLVLSDSMKQVQERLVATKWVKDKNAKNALPDSVLWKQGGHVDDIHYHAGSVA